MARYNLPRIRQSRRKLNPKRKRRRMRRILQRDGNNCWLCGLPLGEDMTIEHLEPYRKGGADTLDNVVFVHDACNQKLGDNSLEDKLNMKRCISR